MSEGEGGKGAETYAPGETVPMIRPQLHSKDRESQTCQSQHLNKPHNPFDFTLSSASCSISVTGCISSCNGWFPGPGSRSLCNCTASDPGGGSFNCGAPEVDGGSSCDCGATDTGAKSWCNVPDDDPAVESKYDSDGEFGLERSVSESDDGWK